MKKLFIIVLNFNGCDNTVSCVKTLLKSRIPQGFSFEVVIVDNNSHDKSVPTFKKEFRDAILIESKKNLGYSGGNNLGINYALSEGATHILVLNNDTLVVRDSIFEMVMGMREYNADVVTPKIYFEKGFEYHKDRYKPSELGHVFWFAGGEMDWKNVIGYHRGVDEVDHGQYDDKTDINFFTGACFLAKAEVFKKVGAFDERYFLYYEDADLSMRVKKHKYKISFTPKSVIYHKNAGSTGGSGSHLQDYFITRSRMLFAFNYADIRAKAAIVRESMRLLAYGRMWQKRGVRDFYLRRFGRGTYPVAP